ncbi:unnamed protein product, partial [Mesorhabditis spiculigera]
MSKPQAPPAHHRRPGQHPNRTPEHKLDFIKPKYNNTLPDIPFKGKFLPCPFLQLNRFVEYKPTELEKKHVQEVQCEADVGVKIDLIDPLTYALPKRHIELHPKDEALVSEEPTGTQNLKRSAQHSKWVPWMRKTEYIGSEFNRFGVSADRQETKVGYKRQKDKKDEEETPFKDRQSEIDNISKTFIDVSKPATKHYNKKDVYAVEEFPLLPDFELWKYSFALVQYDGDPSPLNAPAGLKKEMLAQAQIRGMQDDSGEQFVTHFCPTVETLEKRMADKAAGVPYKPEEKYEYFQNREYTWNVRNKGSRGYIQDSYFLSFRRDGVFYNELDTNVKLTRKTKTFNKRATLVITHCDPTEEEISQMDHRLSMLLDKHAEDEEEDDGNESGEEPEKEKEKKKEHEEEEEHEEGDKDKKRPAPPTGPRRGPVKRGQIIEEIEQIESSSDSLSESSSSIETSSDSD